MTRHLLYNCFAVNHSTEWILNIQKLCQFANTFNGKKIVLIKEWFNTVPFEIVSAQFAPLGDVEFRRLLNHMQKQELVGFIEALEDLKSNDPNEAIFYAHTKGVKHHPRKKITKQLMPNIRKWRDTMYEYLLYDPEKIDDILQKYSCCGCFKKKHLDSWIFSGTFWWVRSDKLFSKKDWNKPKPEKPQMMRYTVERYIGNLFPISEAYCMVGEEIDDQYRDPKMLKIPSPIKDYSVHRSIC